MEVIPDGMRSWVLFTEPEAFMNAQLEAKHSMGGMKGADPKFTVRVRVEGYKDAMPYDFAFRKALKVQTPKAQQGASDMPVTYDLPLASSLPQWLPCFRRHTEFALRTCCSYTPGSYLQKEGSKFKEVEFAYCAEHYIKRSFGDMYNLVLSGVGLSARSVADWTPEQRETASKALVAKLSEPDENGARKFKSILNNKDGAYMGLMNFKNGGPVCGRDNVPLPQTQLFEAVGAEEVPRTPAEFIRDTTYGEGSANAAPCMFDMDVRVGQKHVFVVGGKYITDGWNLKEVTFKKAAVGVVARARSVLCDSAPPPQPLHQATEPAAVVAASGRGASPVRERPEAREREREEVGAEEQEAPGGEEDDFSM